MWVGASGIAQSGDALRYPGSSPATEPGRASGDRCYSWQGCFPDPKDTRWRGTPMHGSMRFRIASITKTFTATLVLLLAEEGILGLDDTVARWLGEIVPNAERITVLHLLGMRSGLRDYADSAEFRRAEIEQPLRRWSVEQYIELAHQHGGALFEPGQRWAYSNTNYVLLGLMLERATGDELGRLVTARILEPLGLDATSVPTGPEMPEPYAHGYTYVRNEQGSGWQDVSQQHPGGADGNMISTAEDLLAWLGALLEGTLLGPELRDRMFASTEVAAGVRYGLGVFDCQGAVGHPGGTPGYASAMFRYRDHDFVVLVNTDLLRHDKTVAERIFWRAARTLLDEGEPSHGPQ